MKNRYSAPRHWISNPVTAIDVDALFTRLEAAIDNNGKFSRIGVEPILEVMRNSCYVRIVVKLNGSRKKPVEITGNGDTPDEAVDHLIDHLDFWAEASK